MKKGLIALIIMVGTLMSIPIVKADTFSVPSTYTKTEYISNTNFNKVTELMNYYNTNYSNQYPYYIIRLTTEWSMFLIQNTNQISTTSLSYNYGLDLENVVLLEYENNEVTSSTGNFSLFNINYENNGVTSSSFDLEYYDSNLPASTFIFNPTGGDGEYPFNELNITNFYNDSITIEDGQTFPKLKDLLQYNSYSDYISSNDYTEVNLDNYEYVLLSLKNYNQSEAFQTNLQVIGQIGITPIYNYGQTTKDSITGVKVQDRCNINYTNYTSYPFYVIQQDIQNNVIYAVKKCSNGSKFKYDNTIFDITYITQENEENPTITINGKTYNVIPYEDLPSTATKNEEEGYIPGESGSANDTKGLDNAIKTAQQKMSEIWNTITYFTDFINQIFSTLPEEIRTILISAFTIMIIIGLIKIFIS